MSKNEWMTTEDVAREWRVSTQTVRRILVREEVNVLVLSKKWRIKRADFEQLSRDRYGPVGDCVEQ